MFRADIMQPTQPGLTMQQQQSLNPVEFAQQGSEQLAAKRAAEEASEKKKNTKTLLSGGGVAAGLALLYFSLKKGK